MIPTKPFASLSLDLDNQWSYMKTHGDQGWESFPSYLDVFIPYVLDALDDLNLKITFFIVGQDAALEKNSEALGLLTKRGHEVGNHSFHHEPWLATYSRERIEMEIRDTEEHIVRVTGQKPVGFRGPGFSWSSDLFEVLVENGYQFDASTLPTYLGPLARLYYFKTAKLTGEEKKQRKDLFGGFKDGLRPVKPYCWRLRSGLTLLEIPVTTIPWIKLPFHLSYLIYLSRFSVLLMKAYLRTAVALCHSSGTQPSFLLHPLDLIGKEQLPQLAFFPGMDLSGARKIELFKIAIGILAERFQVVKMSVHAQSLLNRGHLKVYSPALQHSG
jgi:peptidoglycan-N-acetylglucosamine deacetylase